MDDANLTYVFNFIDFLLKFLVIGEAGTGKSSILKRFIDNKYSATQTHTIGVEFGSKIVSVGRYRVKLQIWDTAGQERFRSVTRSYYRGAAGGLLVFDIANRKSFESVDKWMNDARTLGSPDIVLVMVGNKADLEQERQVSYIEASRIANINDVVYIETSARSGDGIEDVFMKITRTLLTKIETGVIDPANMGSGIQYGNTSIARFEDRSHSVSTSITSQVLNTSSSTTTASYSPSNRPFLNMHANCCR